MLAREYCDKLKKKEKRMKPVILSHEMLPGLLEVCCSRLLPPTHCSLSNAVQHGNFLTTSMALCCLRLDAEPNGSAAPYLVTIL